MSNIVLQDIFLLLILIGFSIPLGRYIDRVMSGRRVLLSRLFAPLEKGAYRLMGIQAEEEMSAKKYALSVLVFSLIGLITVWLLMVFIDSFPSRLRSNRSLLRSSIIYLSGPSPCTHIGMMIDSSKFRLCATRMITLVDKEAKAADPTPA